MTYIRNKSKKSIPFDLEELIHFLRQEYNVDGRITVTVGENKSKNFRGEAGENSIYINLDKVKTNQEFIEAVIHEFVHVWQFQRGDLSHNSNGDLTWKGEFKKDGIAAPWELEAMMETIRLT